MFRDIHRLLSTFFFDPISLLIKWRAIPDYIKNVILYNKLNKNKNFKISFLDTYFTTYNKFLASGETSGHYFFQDLWAAIKIYNSNTKVHYDVGSRIDGFIAHILPFCKVNYIDIRNVNNKIYNFKFIKGNILALPFKDNTIDSLSCLHVIEHVG